MEYVEVCNIRVVNKDTKVVFDHKKVPMEHVKLLAASPNLSVEVQSTYRIPKDELPAS
jgi:hypothetical protein